MLILAIEQSSAVASLACLRDNRLLAEQSWEYGWGANQQLFAILPGLLDKAQVKLEDVEVFAAGTGPGSFAGTRSSVTAARSLALPCSRRAIGISSGEALAVDIAAETGTESVTIVGDARRDHAWFGHFIVKNGVVTVIRPWTLQPVASLAEALKPGSVVAGPDWSRLSGALERACPPSARLITHDCHAHARTVALLAARLAEKETVDSPPAPIYLHPPVSAKTVEGSR